MAHLNKNCVYSPERSKVRAHSNTDRSRCEEIVLVSDNDHVIPKSCRSLLKIWNSSQLAV